MERDIFDPEKLMSLEVPDDITLGESRPIMMKICFGIAEAIKPRTLRVRFLINEEECSDEMTVGEWRQRNGTIAIDEGSGGVLAKEPEPVLCG
jgi:hypothetical protein